MLLRHFYDEKLAQASYLVGCPVTGEAIVIDPARHVQPYLDAAEAHGLTITAVTETHIHADFASGARELGARTGAMLLLSGEGGEGWQYTGLDDYAVTLLYDGDTFSVGDVQFTVIHTPGHTPEHLIFKVTDRGDYGFFTGDFLFVGDVGRPDLLEKAAGLRDTAEVLAHQMFAAVQRIKGEADYLQVFPGHGAGSACGKALGAVPSSTIGY
ncbi:MAG: MBL fold metallo-hydrolase, partial [Phototrophicaceae bacterium]